MTKYEIIDKLLAIREYSESMAKDAFEPGVWLDDLRTIDEAIAIIRSTI